MNLYDDVRRLSVPTSGSLRRRAHQRRQAELTRADGERIAQERRQQRAREKLESQRKAREELSSYEPWGKAGGGAPNARGVRFSDIRSLGIFPEDELRGVPLYEACRRWAASQQRRRRRTPIRLREDPQLCYADNLRQSVDNDIRYRQTPVQQQHYKQILDDLVDKRKRAIKEEVRRNLEYERKMVKEVQGWTNNEIFNNLKGDHRQRSSLTLPKVKRADDLRVVEVQDKENAKYSGVGKLPDINDSPSDSSKVERIIYVEQTGEPYGNGKGKRSPKKRDKFVKRLSNGDKVRRTVPDEEYDVRFQKSNIGNSLEKKLTPEETILRLTGGIELVPLLARRRRVGARTLPSSDVTRPPDQSCQWREMLDAEHLRILKHQMRVKSEQNEVSRRDSAESVRLHHATWASLWGRPGHGAPQQRGRYARSNLAQLLYVTPLADA